MRTSITVVWLFAILLFAIPSGPAAAVPLPSHRVAGPAPMIQAVGHRTHHRVHRRYAKHGYKHRKCRKGWLPPLKEHRHAAGKWSHKHCHDWHRCHYYFYGYKQWARWNPDKSRAHFLRRYHH